MSGVAISIQTLGNSKDTYLRKVVGSLRKDTVLKAVEEMLDDQPTHTIGNSRRSSFSKQKKQKRAAPVVRGDEDAKVRGTLDETVEHAFAE